MGTRRKRSSNNAATDKTRAVTAAAVSACHHPSDTGMAMTGVSGAHAVRSGSACDKSAVVSTVIPITQASVRDGKNATVNAFAEHTASVSHTVLLIWQSDAPVTGTDKRNNHNKQAASKKAPTGSDVTGSGVMSVTPPIVPYVSSSRMMPMSNMTAAVRHSVAGGGGDEISDGASAPHNKKAAMASRVISVG